MAVVKAFSMPTETLSWYLSQQERRVEEVLYSVNCFFFFFLLIHCIINTWSHFKEIYKFLLNSEMLATFPLNITMAKYLYPKLLFSLQIITVEAVYDLLFQIHRTIQM